MAWEPSTFMGDLGPTELSNLLRIGQRRRVPRSRPLFLEGDPANFVAVVTTGSFRIVSASRTGTDSLLALVGPGELIGEMAAFDPAPLPRAATANAFESSEALLVPCDRFLDYLRTHPSVALVILRHLSQRMRAANEVRTQLGADSVSVRVARRLLALCGDTALTATGPLTVPVAVSHTDLASWIGASRESVSRSLRDLREAGLVASARRSIEILDPAGLRQHAR